MELKTTEGIAAEFAKRNAKKVQPAVEHRQHTHCKKCGHEFRRTEPTCFDSRNVPLCYDCAEGGVIS